MPFPPCIPNSAMELSPEGPIVVLSHEAVRELLTSWAGERVTIYLPGLVHPYYASTVTVLSAPQRHGFITEGGGWALYSSKGDSPSWRALVRFYRRKRKSWLRLDDVLSVRKGWYISNAKN